MKVGFGRRYQDTDMEFVGYDQLWETIRKKKPVPSQPEGAGTVAAPYVPTSVGAWYWLAQADIGADPTFILVGRRLIARWGTKAEGAKNYSSDVTDLPHLRDGTKKSVGEIKDLMDKQDDQARIPTGDKATIYSRKAMRVTSLDPQVAAREARNLMQGQSIGGPCEGELANSLCGLLICEGHKSRDNSGCVVFLATLMLLDLVEAGVKYGHKHQQYTWASMLMHGASKLRTPVPAPDTIPGRSKSANPRDLAKHPMAGAGTVELGKAITNVQQDNAARNRVISVFAAWLANCISERDSTTDYKYFFVKQDAKTWVKGANVRQKTYLHLAKLAELGLATRSLTLDCMITGKKSGDIGYVDENGKPIT